MATCIKAFDNDISVIVGGPHPSIMPEDLLIKCKNIDICVIGEGELTISELVSTLEKGKSELEKVEGIAFRNKMDKIIITRRRGFIQNLDELPFLDRAFIPKKIRATRGGFPVGYPNMYLVTSRGCPYQCAFCQPTSDTMFGKKIRRRSVQNVIDEIVMLKRKYDIGGLWINDDTLFTNKDWLYELCDSMTAEKLDITWVANGRFGPLCTEETLGKMKAAGCVYLIMAIEAGSERIRNQVLNKGISNKAFFKYVDIVKKSEIPWHTNIIIDNPTESVEELLESVKMINSTKPNYMGTTYLSLLPGTYLYEQYKSKYAYLARDDYSMFYLGQMKPQEYSNIPVDLKRLTREYFHYKYWDYSPYARCRNFFENSYSRKMCFYFRLKTLICKRNKNLKHFLYDLYLLFWGSVLYFSERIFGDSKLNKIMKYEVEPIVKTKHRDS